MNNYTNDEIAYMNFVYGLANGNKLEARRFYVDMFFNVELNRFLNMKYK